MNNKRAAIVVEESNTVIQDNVIDVGKREHAIRVNGGLSNVVIRNCMIRQIPEPTKLRHILFATVFFLWFR